MTLAFSLPEVNVIERRADGLQLPGICEFAFTIPPRELEQRLVAKYGSKHVPKYLRSLRSISDLCHSLWLGPGRCPGLTPLFWR